MKQTIYISDLDGTLLNSKKQVTEYSYSILNELIEEGTHFSVATARTPATVEVLLKDLHIHEPIVVMNGVALYDLEKHEYVSIEYLKAPLAQKIMHLLGDTINEAFIYTIKDNELKVHYNKLTGKGRINFYEERKNLKYKHFVKSECTDYDEIIYFVFIDKKEAIEAIYESIHQVEGLDMVMYKDIYDEEAYFLEVYSDQATKLRGIERLKTLRGFDRVVCFGDQLNDLSMFKLSEEAYAVANAVEEVKAAATAVIGSNDEDSVAKYILSKQEQRKEEGKVC